MHRVTVSQLVNKTMNLEIYVVDHCNLNCRGCNRFSSIAEKKEYDFDTLIKDLSYIRDLKVKVDHFTLTGGEPLLHTKLTEITQFIINNFPETTQVVIHTNGKKFLKMPQKFYDCIIKYRNRVQIMYTNYPVIDYKPMHEFCEKNNIWLTNLCNVDNVYRPDIWGLVKDEFVMEPFKKESNGVSKARKFFELCMCLSPVLKNSKIYRCARVSNIHIVEKKFDVKFDIKDDDVLDLYKITNINDYLKFIQKPSSFCDYCYNVPYRKIPYEVNHIVKADFLYDKEYEDNTKEMHIDYLKKD